MNCFALLGPHANSNFDQYRMTWDLFRLDFNRLITINLYIPFMRLGRVGSLTTHKSTPERRVYSRLTSFPGWRNLEEYMLCCPQRSQSQQCSTGDHSACITMKSIAICENLA